MRANIIWTVVMTSLVGCGGAAVHAPSATAPHTTALAATTAAADPTAPAELAAIEPEAIDTTTLPEAPWSEAPLTRREVPAPLLAAWERADNRDVCAPMAPRSFGAASGARARTSELEGGWAVEFDRRGLPGLGRDGAACPTCGRGVFGIAGTSLAPEALAGDHAAGPAPSFRDGSHAEVEVSEGEPVAAATIVVAGGSCVYQVWSFLGREHVEELVRELRRVEVPVVRSAGTLASAH